MNVVDWRIHSPTVCCFLSSELVRLFLRLWWIADHDARHPNCIDVAAAAARAHHGWCFHRGGTTDDNSQPARPLPTLFTF